MTGSAKQSRNFLGRLDCFVAEFIIGPAEGGTRWLLAMTVRIYFDSRSRRASVPVSIRSVVDALLATPAPEQGIEYEKKAGLVRARLEVLAT